ncbi:N-acetylglucosaminyl-diphospho-decaprenol L-rhamnosyltransferase [Geobacter sp. OR-1]|uniref:glycosyltransferase family 2 protein n=1 Tax=Geobacter sp. OR-1 TaxID=1266765 RepID=UPI0005430599|nr:glycosyltransferase family 2 protein [Geobacter sp. OR-1]GAM07929.1 N-acetylglucosaminyl-diphospho-decaprenol L-rhamnosyltransferase [Geobacter sp. OR-1]
MDLSVIIVNYNTRVLLLDCLASVYATVSPLLVEIFVIDNASTDGSVAAVQEAFPGVRCIANTCNLGFARANNLAIRAASGRYLMLLNSDAQLTPSAAATIVSFMDANRDVAICGGQLLNRDGSLQNSIANCPTLATELFSKSLLRRLFPARYPGKEARFSQPVEVESIIGACMVVAKEAVDRVGMLDERFFFFFEETDWCLQMKDSGWRVMFHPAARIYHLQGQSAKRVNVGARIEYWRSRYLYFRKHRSIAACFLLRCGLVMRLILSLTGQLATALFSANSRSRLRINATLLCWHLSGCPSSWGINGGMTGVTE